MPHDIVVLLYKIETGKFAIMPVVEKEISVKLFKQRVITHATLDCHSDDLIVWSC